LDKDELNGSRYNDYLDADWQKETGTWIRCPRMILELYNETMILETIFNNDTVYFETIYLNDCEAFDRRIAYGFNVVR
jgi:hypothetical protein